MRVCVCVMVMVSRWIVNWIDCGDHDDRDHGVRELDALRLQDGYLLCHRPIHDGGFLGG